MFRSTAHVGAFVRSLTDKLHAERASPDAHPLLEQLWRDRAGPVLPAAPPNDDNLFLQDLTEEELCALERGVDLSVSVSVSGNAPAHAHAPAPASATASAPAHAPDPDPPQFIVDTAVYTRNRAMRLYLSCKFGKTAPLLPAAANAAMRQVLVDSQSGNGDPLTIDYWLAYARGSGGEDTCLRESGGGQVSNNDDTTAASTLHFWTAPQVQVGSRAWEARLWKASLITDCLPPWWRSVAQAEADSENAGGAGAGVGAGAGAGDLPPPLATIHPTEGFRILYHSAALIPPGGDLHRSRATTIIKRAVVAIGGGGAGEASASSTSTSTSLISRMDGVGGANAPFRDLVAWVCAAAAACGSCQGVAVSRWSANVVTLTFRESDGVVRPTRVVQSLSIVLLGTRWCAGVGRHHRSNGIYWVVNLMSGCATQRCFDPDCRTKGAAATATVSVPSEFLPQQSPDGGILVV